jgi:hypothetical protein
MGTDIVVYFVEQESQGIALFEIWASNTPTFVWNPGYWQYNMKNFRSSAAPYLTSKTGRFFRDKLEFEALIRDENIVSECTPRAWVLEHGTHKRAAEVFLNAIGYEY